MSGSMRIAKAQLRGDPGIFDFVGKAIKGVVKAVVPGASAVWDGIDMAKNALFGGNGKPLNPSITTSARALPSSAINVLRAGNMPTLFPQQPRPGLPPLQQPDSVVTRQGSQIPGLFQGPTTTTTHYSPAPQARPGAPCGSGFHTNKTGYYTRQGYVQPGSKCVRNRKRNPLNPRAASRAMSRLSSAKKAAKFLGSISIREKGCGCK